MQLQKAARPPSEQARMDQAPRLELSVAAAEPLWGKGACDERPIVILLCGFWHDNGCILACEVSTSRSRPHCCIWPSFQPACRLFLCTEGLVSRFAKATWMHAGQSGGNTFDDAWEVVAKKNKSAVTRGQENVQVRAAPLTDTLRVWT